MNLILKKLLVKTNTCRQRAILAIDASDKSLPRLLICASDRERSLTSKMMPWVSDWEKNQKMLPLEAKPLWLITLQLISVFELGRDFATFSRLFIKCRIFWKVRDTDVA